LAIQMPNVELRTAIVTNTMAATSSPSGPKASREQASPMLPAFQNTAGSKSPRRRPGRPRR
jgi:hypothetical protein